ncbi:histamine receptor H2b [Hoplias malabaricus]|uniref:histamine receptor H2b n=1 Tax=Hoplias malabaricus TaxID=27720 RepID=UPI003461F539
MVSTVFRWLMLVAFITLTIGGNVLVCLAVGTSRRLRQISNCFIVSLALTDLLLGLLVLPLTATLELRSGRWSLGGTFCNIYISVDVMLCTASIFTLLAISVDRYLAISAPLEYSRRVTPLRVGVSISGIWIVSMTVAFVPIQLGLNTEDFIVQNMGWEMGDEGKEGKTCRYEWNNNYVLLNASGTFFLPLLVMCGMYHRIFLVAREQARRIRAATPSFIRSPSVVVTAREHKATVTLAAVLGAFIVCWLPYFIYFTCMGLRRETNPPPLTHSVVLWLGYFNSALNPILYPALNRDFRRAYSHLIHCGTSRKGSSNSSRNFSNGLQIQQDNPCGPPHLNLSEVNDGGTLVNSR